MLGDKADFGDSAAWDKMRAGLNGQDEYISDVNIQKDAAGNAVGGYYEVVSLEKGDAPVWEQIAKYRAYLDETDWYVIRRGETGALVPEEVSEQRQLAREKISALRGEK